MFGGVVEDTKMTLDAAFRWVDQLVSDPYAWVIEVEGQGIGEIRLHRINLEDQTASLALGILDPDQLGRGLGRESISLLSQHAFHDLNLHRLAVRVLAFNERAIRCYQACGFVIEGRERQTCRIGDERHDDIIMGLLVEEFRNSAAGPQCSGGTNPI